MNAIIGMAELLTDESTSIEERKEYNIILQNNCFRLLKLINNLLEVAKKMKGQYAIEMKLFSLNRLMEKLRLHFITQAQKNNIVFSLFCGLADGEDSIFSDEKK